MPIRNTGLFVPGPSSRLARSCSDRYGDRLASLVFGNKMETDRDAEIEPAFSASANATESVI
jgi:hypothetical protein